MFHQTANGSFEYRQKPNTAHCGPAVSDFPARAHANYEVKLTFGPEPLDSNGFLLDNTFFRSYFDSLKDVQVSISCELLARQIAFDFASELKNRDWREISVCIEAITGAKVHFTLDSADQSGIENKISLSENLKRTPGSLWL